ncbi:MAG: sulfatase [bacterium]|nr:sulfatase [bacterium]
MKSSRRRFLKHLACAVPSVAIGCGRLKPRDPHVVLIVLDTLRADHVGCYGCSAPLTPNLDAFADEATRYTRAFSTASWTLSSHASMFTGRFPFEHFAHRYDQDLSQGGPSSAFGRNELPLAGKFTTLAEVLQGGGYETVGVSANRGFVNRTFGLHQGFRFFDSRYEFGPAVNERIQRMLDIDRDMPLFLFVNYMDVHGPCNTAPCPRVATEPIARPPKLWVDLFDQIVGTKGPPIEKDLELYKTHYRLGVANADAALGDAIRSLKKKGLYDNAVVMVTSDHGDYLGEHGLFLHGTDIHDETIRIPLLVKAPGQRAGTQDDCPMSCVDFLDLIAKHLSPGLHRACTDVFPYRPGNHPVVAEQYFALSSVLNHPEYGHRFKRVRRAIVDWPMKFIHTSKGRHELYNLEDDPREARNLIDDLPEREKALTAELDKLLSTAKTPPEIPIDDVQPATLTDDEADVLRALGYF